MMQGRRGEPLREALLLLLILWARSCIPLYAQESKDRGVKKFGDKCSLTRECGFEGSICDDLTHKCLCKHELPVTNHLDKCGVSVRVNESCFFTEQCEAVNFQTECKDGVCICRFDKQAVIKPDGHIECEGLIIQSMIWVRTNKHDLIQASDLEAEDGEAVEEENDGKQEFYFDNNSPEYAGPSEKRRTSYIFVQTKYTSEKYIDPAMIGILVAMFLMMITICVVLRLFSKARWRENRSIFNTPNPRLMNVSLLKDNKHHDRRGSRTSRGPSRQPSMASLRAQSPNSQGSRRGSRGSSNVSATSARSIKSPQQTPVLNSAATPMLESVTVEIQDHKP